MGQSLSGGGRKLTGIFFRNSQRVLSNLGYKMYLVRSFSVGSALSTVLEKLSLTNHTQAQNGQRGRSEPSLNDAGIGSASTNAKLRFHAVRGTAMTLDNDFSVARRDEKYFEHSVVFSNRPIMINEIVAVEIMKISTDFHGPLRIGLTSQDPSSFENGVVPLGRDLKNRPGNWIKSVQLFPMRFGSVVYFKVDSDGVLLYGVQGENGGVFLKDVDISQPLWAVVEAYGSVQALRFVDKSMELFTTAISEQNYAAAIENRRYYRSPNNTVQRMGNPARRLPLHPVNSPLHSRRNVRLAPLQNENTRASESSLLSPRSPMTPAFSSPTFSPGLCLICTEREKNTAFTKCGHLCMCYDCAEEFKNRPTPSASGRSRKRNLCPVCRQPIISTLRIYI